MSSTQTTSTARPGRPGSVDYTPVLEHLEQHGRCSTGSLFDRFGVGIGGKAFYARLKYLVRAGLVRNVAEKRNVEGLWELVRDDKPQQPPGRDDIKPPPYVGEVVRASTYDVMRAPAYCPAPLVAARPGAEDFRQCQSRGFRC